MIEQEKQELNETLAKWVGLRNAIVEHDIIIFTDVIGNEVCDNLFIDCFTDSLDACFRHLVPKLGKCNISKNNRLSVNVDCPNRINVEVMIDKSYHKNRLLIRNELWGRAMDNSASLALCLAIEKLIEKET